MRIAEVLVLLTLTGCAVTAVPLMVSNTAVGIANAPKPVATPEYTLLNELSICGRVEGNIGDNGVVRYSIKVFGKKADVDELSNLKINIYDQRGKSLDKVDCGDYKGL